MKTRKKLTLHKESIRNLSPQELQDLDGGGSIVILPSQILCITYPRLKCRHDLSLNMTCICPL